MNALKEIAAYCAANIEDWEPRVQIALGIIERNRCPLSMADASLYGQIRDCIDEWCESNDMNGEDFEEEDVLFTD